MARPPNRRRSRPLAQVEAPIDRHPSAQCTSSMRSASVKPQRSPSVDSRPPGLIAAHQQKRRADGRGAPPPGGPWSWAGRDDRLTLTTDRRQMRDRHRSLQHPLRCWGHRGSGPARSRGVPPGVQGASRMPTSPGPKAIGVPHHSPLQGLAPQWPGGRLPAPQAPTIEEPPSAPSGCHPSHRRAAVRADPPSSTKWAANAALPAGPSISRIVVPELTGNRANRLPVLQGHRSQAPSTRTVMGTHDRAPRPLPIARRQAGRCS